MENSGGRPPEFFFMRQTVAATGALRQLFEPLHWPNSLFCRIFLKRLMFHQAWTCSGAALIFSTAAVLAQDVPDAVPFSGGEFTFAIGEDEEISMSYAGQEVHRAPVIKFDRTLTIAGVEAALFYSGDGGNGCGPQMLIFTLPQDAVDPVIDIAGEECGAPEPAVTSEGLLFVPHVSPGGTALVERWTPKDGLTIAGELAFTPQPETGWTDLDPAKVTHPVELFNNAELYAALQALAGERFVELADKLGTAAPPQLIEGKFLAAAGCQPSACASDKGFIGLDIEMKAVFAAIRTEGGAETLWPAEKAIWPEALLKALEAARTQ
jgi:hypothetical protein